MSSVGGYGVQKEGQEESKIQKEIETVEVERVRGERKVSLLKGLTTNLIVMKICGLSRKLLDVASEVCDYIKGKPRHLEI